ncbi:MAG: prepilin-type N-terminal cleavage/methylation domain-containing protein, partial [Fimbriimonadales bacterium]|nr:prepilin-type N-terminal cleavage/methylation domain-containing protein [Fimbriimonadales bacterium]
GSSGRAGFSRRYPSGGACKAGAPARLFHQEAQVMRVRGFTIAEALVVLVIIAIMSYLLYPLFMKVKSVRCRSVPPSGNCARFTSLWRTIARRGTGQMCSRPIGPITVWVFLRPPVSKESYIPGYVPGLTTGIGGVLVPQGYLKSTDK